MHVELLTEDLFHRLDQSRMRAENAKRLAVGVSGKGCAGGATLLAPHLGALLAVDRLCLGLHQPNLLGIEDFRQEQPAFGVELLDLLCGQLHVRSSSWGCLGVRPLHSWLSAAVRSTGRRQARAILPRARPCPVLRPERAWLLVRAPPTQSGGNRG